MREKIHYHTVNAQLQKLRLAQRELEDAVEVLRRYRHESRVHVVAALGAIDRARNSLLEGEYSTAPYEKE